MASATVGSVLHGFNVGALLGRGTFASVFRATSPTGETVAIKQVQMAHGMSAAERAECLKEAHLLQQLDHPNIIKCHAAFMDGDILNIVLELADAGDLCKLLSTMRDTKQRLPEQYIWKYFMHITRGLAYMHERRIMHRDIKPANVFITRDGVVKVADLGLGRYFSRSKSMANSMVGTPYYMAPERLSQNEYSYPSDVWSAGCLLYEMSALRSPFQGTKNLYDLGERIQRADYPALPSSVYSQILIQLVTQCLQVCPTMRPSMRAMAEYAERVLEKNAAKSRRGSIPTASHS
eukprot:m.220366 g.220366  ORF g.220366 m.220366 type:complete len:292 (-) comp19158_c0_seq2:334-1209(-)